MCCRLTILPYDAEIATAILALGQFNYNEAISQWSRDVEEDNGTITTVRAFAWTEAGVPALRLELSPSISHYEHHAAKRIAGGVYFEIAAKYAEKVGGRIIQLSNVMGCSDGPGLTTKNLANYPEQPLMWQHVCNGFREAIMGVDNAS